MIYWLKHQGTRFPIHRGSYVLGRSPQCFLVLAGRRVSREHAEVRIVGGKLQISDLGSRNGTLVNGQAISEPRLLSAGDLVEVGDERLEVLQQEHGELPAGLRTADPDRGPAALAHRSVLELAEELLMRAAGSEERATVARTIRSIVDALLESLNRSGRKLAKGEAVRLAAVAEVISVWLEGEDLEHWSRQVTLALAI